jgi:cellulose synthase/poly-beta-1,6-N-acetylglucosamine synthase-like glycosyltransferase
VRDHRFGDRGRLGLGHHRSGPGTIRNRDRCPASLEVLAQRSVLPPLGARASGRLVEVRVVDDASTDGTAELLSGCLDARVKPVRHESSLGVAAARNRAASEAKGEWLAFLDDDDLWSPTWPRTALEIARMCDAGAA